MAVLIVLLVSWLILTGLGFILKNEYLKENSGAFAMAIMMTFTGVFHFIYTKGMVLMMPDILPYKTELVYLTGVVEIAAGTGLFLPRFRKRAAIWLIVFFIVILPANVVAGLKGVNISTAAYDGPGMSNFWWFRLPLQLFLILWTWYFCLRKNSKSISERN